MKIPTAVLLTGLLVAAQAPVLAAPSPVIETLLTQAAADFRAHEPKPADVREVYAGTVLNQDKVSLPIVCGRFLPAGKDHAEWADFATIKTDPYEQLLGAQATGLCQLAELERNVGQDLTPELKAKLGLK